VDEEKRRRLAEMYQRRPELVPQPEKSVGQMTGEEIVIGTPNRAYQGLKNAAKDPLSLTPVPYLQSLRGRGGLKSAVVDPAMDKAKEILDLAGAKTTEAGTAVKEVFVGEGTPSQATTAPSTAAPTADMSTAALPGSEQWKAMQGLRSGQIPESTVGPIRGAEGTAIKSTQMVPGGTIGSFATPEQQQAVAARQEATGDQYQGRQLDPATGTYHNVNYAPQSVAAAIQAKTGEFARATPSGIATNVAPAVSMDDYLKQREATQQGLRGGAGSTHESQARTIAAREAKAQSITNKADRATGIKSARAHELELEKEKSRGKIEGKASQATKAPTKYADEKAEYSKIVDGQKNFIDDFKKSGEEIPKTRWGKKPYRWVEDVATGDPILVSPDDYNSVEDETSTKYRRLPPEVVKYAEGTGEEATGVAGAKTAVPKVGDVRKGYRFKGGDPNNKGSWERV